MASRLVLVLGGVRSGKSAFAEGLAAGLGNQIPGNQIPGNQIPENQILYVATGVASDPEMAERIRRHRESRPSHWSTLEEPLELGERVAEHVTEGHPFGGVLIDSLDIWVANLLLENEEETKEAAEARITAALRKLLDAIRGSATSFVLVSSEVGNSLVPTEPLGRRFQDIMGLVNQKVAGSASQVYVVVAGIPNMIKPSGIELPGKNTAGGE